MRNPRGSSEITENHGKLKSLPENIGGELEIFETRNQNCRLLNELLIVKLSQILTTSNEGKLTKLW